MFPFVKKIAMSAGVLLASAGAVHAETISPRRLLEVADLTGPALSPDGSSVAFRLEQASVVRNTFDVFWYVQAMDGKSPPRRVADGGVLLHDSAGISVPGHAVWSPDGHWIYYRALVDGQMSVWRAAVDGSGAEPVTHDAADVRDFALADGKTLKYSVGATRAAVIAAEEAEYDRGIHVDDTVPIAQGGLFRAGNIDGRLETQRFRPDSPGWDRVPLLTSIADQWKAVDLETGKVRDLPFSERPPEPPTTSDLSDEMRKATGMRTLESLPPWKLEIDPDTGRTALLTRTGDEKGLQMKPDVQLAMLPKAGSSPIIKCQAEPCTGKAITSIQWRPRSDEVLFTVTDAHEGQAQSIYRWNVQQGAVQLVTRSAGMFNGGGRYEAGGCAVSSDAMVCVVAKADRPPRLERIDLATGERQVLFEPNVALALDMAKTTPSRLLHWTDAKGEHFTGQFFPALHTADGPSALFVNYYDCRGFLRGGMGDEWPFASLAENGISALCINQAPYRLDAIERYGLGLSAVRSAVDLLASKGEIDRTKVGMGGLSFGTEATLWTMMTSDLLTAASVTSIGMSRGYYLFGSMRGDVFFKPLKTFWQLGAPDQTPKRWRALAPAENLDSIKAPILMQMPEQEYVLALDYAVPLMRGHRADLYVFPNEPHQKFQPRHKLAAYQRNIDWFRFWLQGYEDPDPAKSEEYKRWREMRAAGAKPRSR